MFRKLLTSSFKFTPFSKQPVKVLSGVALACGAYYAHKNTQFMTLQSVLSSQSANCQSAESNGSFKDADPYKRSR